MDKLTMDNKTNDKTKDSTPSIVKIELVRICANRNCEECKSLKHFYHNMVSKTNQHHSIPNQTIYKQTAQPQPTHSNTPDNEFHESHELQVFRESTESSESTRSKRKPNRLKKSHSL